MGLLCTYNSFKSRCSVLQWFQIWLLSRRIQLPTFLFIAFGMLNPWQQGFSNHTCRQMQCRMYLLALCTCYNRCLKNIYLNFKKNMKLFRIISEPQSQHTIFRYNQGLLSKTALCPQSHLLLLPSPKQLFCVFFKMRYM